MATDEAAESPAAPSRARRAGHAPPREEGRARARCRDLRRATRDEAPGAREADENPLREGLRLERVPDPPSSSCSARPATCRTGRCSRPSPSCGGRTCCPTTARIACRPAAVHGRDVPRRAQAPRSTSTCRVSPGPGDVGRPRRADHLPPRRLRRPRQLRRARRAPRGDGRGAGHARQPPVLPRDPALGVPGDRPAAGQGGHGPRAPRRRLAADRHREAVRARPRLGDPPQPRGRQVFRERQVYRIDHYLGQGDRPEPARLPVRQRHLRAALEPAPHRPRADHRRGVDRRREPRRVLRGDGRARATSSRTTCSSS